MCPLSIRLVIFYGIWFCCIPHVIAPRKSGSSGKSPSASSSSTNPSLVPVNYSNGGVFGLVGLGSVLEDGRFMIKCKGLLVQIGDSPTNDVIVTHAESIEGLKMKPFLYLPWLEHKLEHAYGTQAAITAEHGILEIKTLKKHEEYWNDYAPRDEAPRRQDDIGIAILKHPIPVGIFELPAHEENQPEALPDGNVAWIDTVNGVYRVKTLTASQIPHPVRTRLFHNVSSFGWWRDRWFAAIMQDKQSRPGRGFPYYVPNGNGLYKLIGVASYPMKPDGGHMYAYVPCYRKWIDLAVQSLQE